MELEGAKFNRLTLADKSLVETEVEANVVSAWKYGDAFVTPEDKVRNCGGVIYYHRDWSVACFNDWSEFDEFLRFVRARKLLYETDGTMKAIKFRIRNAAIITVGG